MAVDGVQAAAVQKSLFIVRKPRVVLTAAASETQTLFFEGTRLFARRRRLRHMDLAMNRAIKSRCRGKAKTLDP